MGYSSLMVVRIVVAKYYLSSMAPRELLESYKKCILFALTINTNLKIRKTKINLQKAFLIKFGR